MKISKKWIIILVVIIVIIGYFIIKSALKSPTEGLITEKVGRGNVLQEISEAGSVKATDNFSLGFKTIGKVAHLYVAVGDVVKKGDVLAKLDSSQILAQLQSARATLDYTTNQYNAGIAAAEDDLQSEYNSAQNILSDAYTKIYNAYAAVVDLKNNHFSVNDQEGIRVLDAQNDIWKNMQNIKVYIDGAETNSDIDSAVSRTLLGLDSIYNDLKIIRDQCDSGIYYYNVSSTYKTSIDTQKSNIYTASTNLTTAQADISSYKIALQKAEDGTTEQKQADIDVLQSQLNDTSLIAPIEGKITQVNVKRGETVSGGQSIITLLSTNPFQIKTYIYEEDIVNVKFGDDVKIELVAFPKQIFAGKVLLIDPAETIIDNVVYYETTIEFPNQPDGIKSGMTADITIEANKKENVLRILKNALTEIDNVQTVQVVKDGKIENRTITTGLEGNDYYEVLSGLSEGDEIVTGKE